MQDKSRRRGQPGTRRPSSAAAILSSKGTNAPARSGDFFSFDWLLLIGTFITITLISFLFTPYTYQLDEIKNVLLQLLPPFLLMAALWKMDFSAITWKRHGALILLALYFVWMCLSWLINPYKKVGETVIWFNLGVATFAVIFAWYLNSEEKVRKTMIFFVLLGLVSTFLGLFLYSQKYLKTFYLQIANSAFWQTPERQPWSTLVYTFIQSNEMYSFILNSDFYAAFLVMLIPISLSMFFVEQRTAYKTVALASFLMMNVCLFLTNSNDSFLAIFLVTYPLYFLVGWRSVREWGLSRRVVLTFVGCTIVSLIVIGILMLPKLASTYNFKSAAFEGRRVLWGGGFWPWIYGDHFDGKSPNLVSIIFGTGPGGYRHYFPWFRRPDFFDQQIANVTTFGHNIYLDVLLETGFVGLVLFVGFIVRVFADGFRQIRVTPSRTHLFYQLAVLSGLAGIALQNFSSPNNRWAVAGMIYWAMYGLSMGLVSVENPPVTGENEGRKIGNVPVHRLCRWAALGLALLFVGRCVLPGAQFSDYWTTAKAHALGVRAIDQAGAYPTGSERELAYYQMAMLSLETAIEKNPTFGTSFYKLGHVYNRLGNVTDDPVLNEKALRTYEKLDQINPNYSEVHLNLGIMYAQLGSNVAAYRKNLQERAAELKETLSTGAGAAQAQLYDDYALLESRLKDLEGPDDEVTLKIMQRSYDEFKQAARQSLTPNTQYFAASTGREVARLYEDAGQAEKANAIKEEVKKFYWSIINYKPKLEKVQADQKQYYNSALRGLLAVNEETADYDGSIAVLKQMVQDNPDDVVVLQALLAEFDKAKKPKEKLAYMEQAAHENPTDAIVRRALASAYQAEGQQENYLRELRRVEVLQPKNVELLKTIQKAYADSGQTDKAASYQDKLKALGAVVDTPTTPPAAAEPKPTTSTAAAAPTTTAAVIPPAVPAATTTAAAAAAPTAAATAATTSTTTSAASPGTTQSVAAAN